MHRYFIYWVSVTVFGVMLTGCAGTEQQSRSAVRNYFEQATGSAVTYVNSNAVFVRGKSSLAASGRDYIYMAPLAVSRGGEQSYWLWVGVWSTVDRQARNANAESLSIGPLQILADGEPIELELQSAALNLLGIRKLPYETPVSTNRDYLVAVTLSQLQRLGNAQVVQLVDNPAGGAARLWESDARAAALFRQFADTYN